MRAARLPGSTRIQAGKAAAHPHTSLSTQPEHTHRNWLKDWRFMDGLWIAIFLLVPQGGPMKRFVLSLLWVLWAHEMGMVGEQVVDRGYTAVDSFETRQQCHAALADYSALRLVRQGKVRIDFSCLPDKTDPKRTSRTAVG
jgi:hypothetical protein